MSFEAKFPSATDDKFHYGIQDSQLYEVTKNLSEHGKDDVLVIVEVDSDNNHAIKGIELVRGNWFNRTLAWISKVIETFTEGKTYRFDEGAILQDLSSKIDALSEEYEKLATGAISDDKDIQYVLDHDSSFNQTINRVTNFAILFFNTREREEFREKTFTLCFHHDLAITHLKIRETARKIDDNIPKDGSSSEIDYSKELEYLIENRRDLFARLDGTKVHFRDESVILTEMHKPTESTIASVESDLNEQHFLENLSKLAIDGKIDISKLIGLVHKNDPLKSKLEQLNTLKKLAEKLDALENQGTSDVEYINAGIEFIEGFYALDPEVQEKSGLKERFDEIGFKEVAPKLIEELKSKASELEANSDNLAGFADTYQAFVDVMDGLKKARAKITHESMSEVQGILDEATRIIGEKLTSLRGHQLKVLQEKYRVESEEIQQKLVTLKEEQAELEKAQKDSKRLEALSQELVNTISSGKGTDVARLLTVPSQTSVDPSIKNLVLALQALVKQARLEESDVKYQTQRLSELEKLLKAADLPPLPPGMSAIHYINRPEVAKKVEEGLRYAREKKEEAERNAYAATEVAKRAETEASRTKQEDIEEKRGELESIALVEIRSLRNALGMTTLRPTIKQDISSELEVSWSQVLRKIVPKVPKPTKTEAQVEKDEDTEKKQAEKAEAQAKENLEKLFRLVGSFYGTRDHLREVATKAITDAEIRNPDIKYQMALLAIAQDMMDRRDALMEEIKDFEKLYHQDFYSLETPELKKMLEGYQRKYQLPHFLIQEEDVIARANQMKSSGEDTTLIFTELYSMTEAAEAYKYRAVAEEKAARLQKHADTQSAVVVGWDNLGAGLDHLSKTASSFVESEKATLKVASLGESIDTSEKRSLELKARQEVIADRQKELSRLLEAQADLIGAQAIQEMMHQISLFQGA